MGAEGVVLLPHCAHHPPEALMSDPQVILLGENGTNPAQPGGSLQKSVATASCVTPVCSVRRGPLNQQSQGMERAVTRKYLALFKTRRCTHMPWLQMPPQVNRCSPSPAKRQ